MKDPSKLPYAGWLEETIKKLMEHDVACIGLAAITGDHQILTAYFAANMTDKAIMAVNIQGDALMDMTLANARMILDAAEEQEDDDGEDDPS
jgi:hypothetical protein